MRYNILTIEREFGTRGYEIASILSKKLQIPLYDHGAIRMMLQDVGNTDINGVRDYTRRPNSLLYNLATYMTSDNGYLFEVDDETAKREFGVIRRITEQEPCIILGRCSNHILRNRKDVFSVFLTADMEYKKKRIDELVKLSDAKETERLIQKTDKARANYYKHHTGREWGDPKDFDMVLDHRTMSVEEMVKFLEEKFQLNHSTGFSRGVSMYR